MKESRVTQMLELLKAKPEIWIRAASLAGLLGVSTRQIRKYVAAVNDGFALPVILSSDKGYQLNREAYRQYQLEKRMRKDTPAVRQNYILQELVIIGSLSVFDLSDSLFVSLATVEKDLKVIRETLKTMDLDLTRSQNTVQLVGEEVAKRRLMSLLITQETGSRFVFDEEIGLLTFHYQIWGFRSMIRQLFDQCGIFTNDYALNVITLHLIIMIDRIRGGHSLEDSVDLNKIAELPGYSVALKIANYLQQEFGKELNLSLIHI